MRRREQFIITTASSTWLHLVPEGRKEITLLGVFSDDGLSTHSPDSFGWDVVSRMIKVEFGVEEHTGYAIYEYDDGAEVCQGVTVNCGGAAEQPERLSVNVSQQTDIKVGDALTNVAMLDYSAVSPSSPTEAGRLIVIRKDTVASVDAERFQQDELAPMTFSAVVLTDGLYIRVVPDAGETLIFSYTIKTL